MKVLKRYAVVPLAVFLFLGMTGASHAANGNHEKLFPGMPGWERSGEIDVYDWDTIWDIINGAAELFYAYDFQEMYWGQYTNSVDEDIYIVMEIYRQGNPVMAFGVYSQERPRPPRLIDVGVEGFAAPGALHFFVSDLYVRMRSHDTSEETAGAMKKLAGKVAEAADPMPEYPAITGKLPEEGKVAFSEEFINTNFLGHSFLAGAFVSGYDINGTRFNLFVVEHEDPDGCRNMLADYYEFSGQDPGDLAEGVHRMDDRWNGEVGIVWKDRYLYGYYNLEDEALQEKYLEKFSGSN